MREIPGTEAPRLGSEAALGLAVFEDDAVLAAEDRQRHTPLQIEPYGLPIDVEIFGERRALAPFENVEPPGIVGAADGHVVGDEVEDEAHIVAMQRIDECSEIFLAAKLGIKSVMVSYVVTVGRAWARLHDRRSVDMADPGLGRVGNRSGRASQ